MGLWNRSTACFVAQLQKTLSDNDQVQQGMREVIAKSKQSGTSPEQSFCSIVDVVCAQFLLEPIQLRLKQIQLSEILVFSVLLNAGYLQNAWLVGVGIPPSPPLGYFGPKILIFNGLQRCCVCKI
jgi:hypothetical protein